MRNTHIEQSMCKANPQPPGFTPFDVAAEEEEEEAGSALRKN